jgi:regulatory protein
MPTRRQRSSDSAGADEPTTGAARHTDGATERTAGTAQRKANPSKPPADKTSAAALEAAALRYLDRYDASVEQLRRVLRRRLDRQAGPDAVARVERDIEQLLERYQGSRLLDDRRYAENLARGLRERGASTLRIRQKLRQRGVASETIDRVLERSASGGSEDLRAAKAYARRRRLAQRYDLRVPAERQKALAALARQGFSFDVAARALAPTDDDVF